MARNKITVAVIGEGITEKYFVLSLRDVLRIKPMPVKPKNSSLKELENSIKECIKKGYSRIYCLIDLDNKIHDGDQQHENNAKEYEKLKRQYHNKQLKCSDGSKTFILMIESFPATEIFFWYYFGYTSAQFSNQQLKNLLNKKFGYVTEEKYLIRHSIHDTLIQSGGSLKTAVSASKKSMKITAEERFGHSYSEIGMMICELQPTEIDF